VRAIQYMRARRERFRAERRCIVCGAGLQDDDGTRCVECAEAQRKASRKYARTERGKETGAVWQRARYRRDPERHCEAARLRRKLAGIRKDGV